jgi:tRNA (guanine37-N1)-methyltransferase
MLEVEILTLFPTLCAGAFEVSMLARAQAMAAAAIRVHNLRDWARDKHRTTDDIPYGGGPGMILKPEPIFEAVEALRRPETRVILLAPQGRTFRQPVALELSRQTHLILVCGHYEGVDHRVREFLADDEISIGDYVLTNGAIAAAVVTDAVVRLLPGVLGHEDSAVGDTFSAGCGGMLEGPQYTRPAEFRGMPVPPVLLSGNHAVIAAWRNAQALAHTRAVRPDLL